jgi:hypothetical protein
MQLSAQTLTLHDVDDCGDSWLLERPSLAHQHAFDFCAMEVYRSSGPTVVFANNPLYICELRRRLDGKVVSFHQNLGQQAAFPTAVWVAPGCRDGRQVAESAHRLLLPGGCLYVIFSGLMSRFQPNGSRPTDTSTQLQQVCKWLRRAGFVLHDLYGFHGPASARWGRMFLLLERFGRGDLADRCHFRMRGEYVVTGWQAGWSPLGVLIAKKD